MQLHALLRPETARTSARMQLMTGFFRLLAISMVPIAMNVPAVCML